MRPRADWTIAKESVAVMFDETMPLEQKLLKTLRAVQIAKF